MMMVLSREAVKIMSGFSDEVAMAVTSPLWPTRLPLRMTAEERHVQHSSTSSDPELPDDRRITTYANLQTSVDATGQLQRYRSA